jgi:hypothetical protein
MVTGGIAELARLSLPFSNLAFNSAALALICVGRGAVGAMACSMLNCMGENWVVEQGPGRDPLVLIKYIFISLAFVPSCS